jgi:hypothetical protein
MMTWENHGLKTWHIDHIKPLDWFDLKNYLIKKKHLIIKIALQNGAKKI